MCLVFLPVFFAGVIFATAFRSSRQPDVDFGSNIGGIILGGLSEYLSLVVGFNHLLWIAIGLLRALGAAGSQGRDGRGRLRNSKGRGDETCRVIRHCIRGTSTRPRRARLQRELAARVDSNRPLAPYQTVGGADVSYNKYSPMLFAAVVVLRADTLEVIERAGVVAEAGFPYVPGLLSFREAPAVIEAFRKLSVRPDVLICDGQGIAHPRRLGLASHLGLWLGIPTIGCAKSHLFGEYEEPGPERGDWSPMTDGDETIGAVLRTRSRVKPLVRLAGAPLQPRRGDRDRPGRDAEVSATDHDPAGPQLCQRAETEGCDLIVSTGK